MDDLYDDGIELNRRETTEYVHNANRLPLVCLAQQLGNRAEDLSFNWNASFRFYDSPSQYVNRIEEAKLAENPHAENLDDPIGQPALARFSAEQRQVIDVYTALA